MASRKHTWNTIFVSNYDKNATEMVIRATSNNGAQLNFLVFISKRQTTSSYYYYFTTGLHSM